MSLLFETIRVENGRAQNLRLHEQRMNESRRELFGSVDYILLGDLLPTAANGVYRCRVEYDRQIQNITTLPYEKKALRSLRPIEFKGDYGHKFTDRVLLQQAFELRGTADDVLLIKDGLITDTTIANVAFWDSQTWVTPAKPLLKGTMRARLIELGVLTQRDIPVKLLGDFKKMAVMNSLRGFEVGSFVIN